MRFSHLMLYKLDRFLSRKYLYPIFYAFSRRVFCIRSPEHVEGNAPSARRSFLLRVFLDFPRPAIIYA